MPLLCRLGLHSAEPLARWNDGYYFTRCRRCRRDLVRTAYGRWHVPRGFRIVWQARPPASHVPTGLPPAPAEQSRTSARSNRPSRQELPIQEVLRHLQEQEELPEEQPEELEEAATIVPDQAPAAPVAEEPEAQAAADPDSADQPDSAQAALVEPVPEGEPAATAVSQADSDELRTVETVDPPIEAVADEPAANGELLDGAATQKERQSRVPDFMGDWSPTTDWVYIPTRRRPRQVVEAPEPAPAVADAVADAGEEAVEAVPDEEAVEAVNLPGAGEAAEPAPEPVPDRADPADGPAAEAQGSPAPEPEPARPWAADAAPAAAGGTSPAPEPEPARLWASDAAPAAARGTSPAREPELARPWASDAAPAAARRTSGPAEEHPGLTPTAMLVALAIPLLVLIAALLIIPPYRPTKMPAPADETSRRSAAAAPAAFVTASILNCHTAPARQAPSVRRLGRRDTVRILATDGEWASIAFRQEQCWVLSRYLALETPA
ncbi:MAG TPA: hypothetical protein VGX37_12185 [Allosphingosinicella sp.]|jgi:hypothetical protein|nr:hypothetical protein [Allosphingosinicella sp.]